MFQASSPTQSAFSGDTGAVRLAGRNLWPVAWAGLLWLAAGLAAGYWVLQAWGRAPVTPVPVTASAPPVVDAVLLARALGALPAVAAATEATPAVASRYALQGVVAQGAVQGAVQDMQRGVALIAVDGQPARPFRLGAEVAGGLVLQAVTAQQVRLGAAIGGPTTVTLEMPRKPGA